MNDLKYRVGKVNLSEGFFEDINEKALRAVFSEFYPTKIVLSEILDHISYLGHSKHFEPLHSGDPIKTYYPELELKKNGDIVLKGFQTSEQLKEKTEAFEKEHNEQEKNLKDVIEDIKTRDKIYADRLYDVIMDEYNTTGRRSFGVAKYDWHCLKEYGRIGDNNTFISGASNVIRVFESNRVRPKELEVERLEENN